MGAGRDIQGQGYNVDAVNEIGRTLNEMCQNVATEITDQITAEIVTPVSEQWYAEDAKAYFEEFKRVVDSTGPSLQQVFSTLREQVQAAGEAWAERSQGVAPSLPEIETPEMSLNIDAIQVTDPEGSRYIADELESAIDGYSDTCRQNVNDYLSEEAARVETGALFGADQSGAIQTAIENIGTAVDRILIYFDTIKGAIHAAYAAYGSVAQENATNIEGTDYGSVGAVEGGNYNQG